MSSKILGTYVNGNTIVVMYKDGTKVRYVRDGEEAAPEFPESIDLKITNRCDMGCPMCAEASTKIGGHANLDDPLLDSLHPYTELAIGGGNPLEHPGLEEFLIHMHDKKILCNLTVNARHFIDSMHRLHMLSDQKLIYGLGVSVPNSIPDGFFNAVRFFPNVVVHTIAGYTSMEVYDDLADRDLNLLILGFKVKGSGVNYVSENITQIDDKLADLQRNIMSMTHKFKAVAFDNLAVRQLRLHSVLSKEQMDKLYMGDDGDFSMYIDLTNYTFAKSSSHSPKAINKTTVSDLFAQVHGKENYLWQ